MTKVLEFHLQYHSLQRNPRIDRLQNGLVGSPCSPRDSQESSPTPQCKSINSSGLSLLHSKPRELIKLQKESESCSVVSDSFVIPYSPWNSPGQNTGAGGLPLLQGIFPTQGLNPSLPHCRQILYQLSCQGSPKT